MGKPRISKEIKRKAKTAVKAEMHHDEFVLCKRGGDGGLKVVRELLKGESELFSDAPKSKNVLIRPNDLVVSATCGPRKQSAEHNAEHVDEWQLVCRSLASTNSSDAAKSESDDEVVPPRRQMHSFKISDEKKVGKYLEDRLDALQQQANKQIAKAWIKGICPKKQARYPYQNSIRRAREGLDPEIPVWWPAADTVSEFKEPDHISKPDRTNLCLHLLRLRPTVGQLREWHGNGDRTELTKVHEIEGWTAFLKQVTPDNIFDGIDPDRQDKKKRRLRILNDLFDVAEMEERYLNGEYDGNHMFSYSDESEVQQMMSTIPSKRSRRSSADGGDTKRARRDTVVDQDSPDNQLTMDMSRTALDEPRVITLAQLHDPAPQGTPHAGYPSWRLPTVRQDSHHYEMVQTPMAYSRSGSVDGIAYPNSQAPSPLTLSFSSADHDTHNHGHLPERPTHFPGQQNFAFPSYTPVQHFQANRVHEAPQSQYDTVPNTQTFSPMAVNQPPFPCYEPMPQQQPMEVTYVTNSQRYHVAPGATEVHGLPYAPAGFAVPEQQYGIAGALQHATQEMYDYQPGHHLQQPSHGGLSTLYSGVQRPPPREVPEMPYHHMRPDGMCGLSPPSSLPAGVVRGFTGHCSGCGGGAWT